MTDAERAVIEAAIDLLAVRNLTAVGRLSAEQMQYGMDALFEMCDVLLRERHLNAKTRIRFEPGRTKLTRAQRALMDSLLSHDRDTAEVSTTSVCDCCYRNTTQLRRLLPFVRANSHLIEELPRTPRGGWGYKLKDGVDPRKVEIP